MMVECKRSECQYNDPNGCWGRGECVLEEITITVNGQCSEFLSNVHQFTVSDGDGRFYRGK